MKAMQQAVDEAGRKARRSDWPPITAEERDHLIEQLRVNPLPIVKRDSGRSYLTLCRIAQVAL